MSYRFRGADWRRDPSSGSSNNASGATVNGPQRLHAPTEATIHTSTASSKIPINHVQPRSPRMCDDNDQTKPDPPAFDFSAFPYNTLFHERANRSPASQDRCSRPPTARHDPRPRLRPAERRAKKDRRRRIDPTTFEKQYTPDEMEFMNAMQRFKEDSGKSFPTHAEVLKVAIALGYRLADRRTGLIRRRYQ